MDRFVCDVRVSIGQSCASPKTPVPFCYAELSIIDTHMGSHPAGSGVPTTAEAILFEDLIDDLDKCDIVVWPAGNCARRSAPLPPHNPEVGIIRVMKNSA